jgi:aspartate carbamoyltransferase
MSSFLGKDIISITDFSKNDIKELIELTEKIRGRLAKKKHLNVLKGYTLCSLFYEVSTRTRFSYETAILHLGGSVISAPEAENQTSASKGESLQDAIRVIEKYADVIVLRHPQVGAAKLAADSGEKPLINGGDGSGEHPTQGLSDIYTIFCERGTVDGLNITLLGDLKYSRAIHSIALGLAKFEVNVNFVSPEGLEISKKIMNLYEKGRIYETNMLKDVLSVTDVIYMTRTQLERFETKEEKEKYLSIKDQFCLNSEILQHAKPGLTVMHPGPRIGGEISEDLDGYDGFAYFRQVDNAIFNRMALLGSIFGKL